MERINFWLASAALFLQCPLHFCHGQLNVLSSGNVNVQWRATQLELIQQQLADPQIKGQLRLELTAQHEWLKEWSAGDMSETPSFPQKRVDSLLVEPSIDPDGKAGPLRERLLGPKARPTIQDTEELFEALKANPEDVGLRQLRLHWLDQRQYRKEYASEIADSARRLAVLFEKIEPQTEDLKLARGFSYYRCGRALAYQELPEVVAQKPIADPQRHEAELLGAYAQMVELLGKDRPEFILLEVRMLKRDHWYGQALMLLEQYGDMIDRQWFLKKRRDLLQELGWSTPAQEAAEIYAKAYPEEAASEAALEAKLTDG